MLHVFPLAAQVIGVCTAANPRIEVRRARFSALVHADVSRAVNNLVRPWGLKPEASQAHLAAGTGPQQLRSRAVVRWSRCFMHQRMTKPLTRSTA